MGVKCFRCCLLDKHFTSSLNTLSYWRNDGISCLCTKPYLTQCCLIVILTLGKKTSVHLNINAQLFLSRKYILQMTILFRPRLVNNLMPYLKQYCLIVIWTFGHLDFRCSEIVDIEIHLKSILQCDTPWNIYTYSRSLCYENIQMSTLVTQKQTVSGPQRMSSCGLLFFKATNQRDSKQHQISEMRKYNLYL